MRSSYVLISTLVENDYDYNFTPLGNTLNVTKINGLDDDLVV